MEEKKSKATSPTDPYSHLPPEITEKIIELEKEFNHKERTIQGNVALRLWQLGIPAFNAVCTQDKYQGWTKNFEGLAFPEGYISFSVAQFGDGDVNFKDAQFGDGDVFFTVAQFGEGEVNFNEAQFGEGDLNFSYAQFGQGFFKAHSTNFSFR